MDIDDNEDWLIIGDSNYIRAQDNRNNPGGGVSDMITFDDMILRNMLLSSR